MSAWQSPSLYIGDLNPTVTEEELTSLFEVHGDLESVKICRNWNTGVPLGYGFINYRSIEAATKALNALNYCSIRGKPCRLMWSTKRSIAAVSEEKAANIYVKGLSRSIDNKALHELFSECGTVLSAKVARNKTGVSLGYGYVSYTRLDAANKAISELNGRKLEGLFLSVEPFVEKQRRSEKNSKTIKVGQIPLNWTENVLELRFYTYGSIKTVHIHKDTLGQSTGTGYVEFYNAQSAKLAVEDNVVCQPYHLGTNPILSQPLSVTFGNLESMSKKNFETNFPVQNYYTPRKARTNSYGSCTSVSDFASFTTGQEREQDLLGWDSFDHTSKTAKLKRAAKSESTDFTIDCDIDNILEDINRKVFITEFEPSNYFDEQLRK